MKARFDIRFPLNGRHTPAQDGAPTAPRCHIRTDRPSSQQVPIPDEVMTSSGIGSELNLKLEDEIPTPEIEAYTRYLVLLSSNEQENPELSLIDILPSYVLSLIHISEPTRLLSISYAVFCLKKKK